MMKRLDQKIALVTGGASGLGKVIAQRLVSDGARVVITDVQSELGQKTAIAGGFAFIEQDVTDASQWTEVIQQVEARFGGLDILVNNAGILGSTKAGNPENCSLANWRGVFAVNVEGVFLGCQAAIGAMRRAGGGSIINISSIAGLLADPLAIAYGASKAAVRQLTKSVAQYCAEQKLNIRCNSVHPGIMQTPLGDRDAEDTAQLRGISVAQVFAELKSSIPLGDFTRTEDVAAAVSFLVSDAARHMTGSKLVIDGGIVDCDTFQFGSRASVANDG
jgi:NAD(P)-dependent dehydrogenase (short-subunit alcohol dehydrogenase family)